jgi:hypothetical protein
MGEIDMYEMKDHNVPLLERIDRSINRIERGNGHMRVPAEATDPDVVLDDCRKRIKQLEAIGVRYSVALEKILAVNARQSCSLEDARTEVQKIARVALGLKDMNEVERTDAKFLDSTPAQKVAQFRSLQGMGGLFFDSQTVDSVCEHIARLYVELDRVWEFMEAYDTWDQNSQNRDNSIAIQRWQDMLAARKALGER